MKHSIFGVKIAVFFALCALAATISAKGKHEIRAVWLTTIGGLDWPHYYAQSPASAEKQKKEFTDMLDRLRLAGINTVLLQTRVRATTVYPSAIEPWDGCMSGRPGLSPGYDPLAFAVEECHRRGMELHAWVVSIPIGKWNNYGCRRLRKALPDLVKRIGDEGFIDPEKPAAASYIASICAEITSNYDIDGIHLDYIRYPETWKGRIDHVKGRANITRIVRSTTETVKRLKPWVKMSCSPVGKHDDLSRFSSYGWNARTKVCQDAQQWLADGLMDQLYPMMYFRGNQFYPFAIDWKENVHGGSVAPGLGIYFLSPREKDWDVEIIRRQLHFLRDEGLGQAFFRCKFLLDNVKGIYDLVSDEVNVYPSLVPPLVSATPLPQPPRDLVLQRVNGTDRLSWTSDKPWPQSDGMYHLFNIYASTTYPVDTSDPANLLASRLQSTSLDVPTPSGMKPLHYAVTSTDRFSRESSAVTTAAPSSSCGSRHDNMLRCDGTTLFLPIVATDAAYLAVESTVGNIVTTRPYAATVDVSTVPDGFYVARTLNRKGTAHRLGFFIINRKQ